MFYVKFVKQPQDGADAHPGIRPALPQDVVNDSAPVTTDKGATSKILVIQPLQDGKCDVRYPNCSLDGGLFLRCSGLVAPRPYEFIDKGMEIVLEFFEKIQHYDLKE